MADISKVTIPSGTYDIKDATARADIANLATVATTGSYNDLLDKPSIGGSYTAGDGIDITNNVVSNTAGMYTENIGATVSNPVLINADLLQGHDSSYFMQAGSTIDADLLQGHDSSYFAKASNIPNGLTLLWTNSSSGSEYGDTELTFDLSAYNYVIITFRTKTSSAYYVDVPFPIDSVTRVAWGLDYAGSSNPIVARGVIVQSTRIHFNVAYSYGTYLTGTQNNSVMVPYKIYGGY